MRKNREEQEVRDLDELFERYRQAPGSYVFVPLADACRKMGRFDEALEICEGGVRRHPAYASGHVVKGKCLYDKGDRPAARETFERVLMLDENNLVALKYLGMIEAEDGDIGTAGRHFRQILSLDPDNKEIKTILRTVDVTGPPAEKPEPLCVDAADVMEGVDEILQGAVADDDPLEVDDGPEGDTAAGEDSALEESAAGAVRGELETSDELASVTLAEIFASQGYKSKAEKIYREVLKRQPANEDVRQRLRDLAPDSGGTETVAGGSCGENTGAQEDVRSDSGGSQCEEPAPLEISAPPDLPPAPEPDSTCEAPSRPTEEIAAGVPDGSYGPARTEISEKDSLSHFRRWLTRIQS
jgi:tetratricopeptide (TPR) repeat protein